MLEAAETAADFLRGRTRAELDSDRMLLFAVLRAIEVLGEAASRVSEETRGQTDNIPWTAVVGMRNRLIHGYMDVDTEIVWRTATDEIPALAGRLRVLLASL
jgi:uncharacterized protein with HEPN domain